MSSLSISGDTSGAIIIAAPSVAGSNTLTLPVGTDTLVGKATIDTLTNKTISSPTVTGTVSGSASYSTPTLSGTTTLSSLTTHGAVVTGSGTGVLSVIAPGTSGNVLKSDGSAWTSASGTSYRSLNITRDMSSASGSVSTAHGGSSAPKALIVFANIESTASYSNGMWDSGTNGNRCIFKYASSSTTNYNANFIQVGDNGSNGQTATISSVDATNITLSWTKFGSPTLTMSCAVLVIF